MNFLLVICPDIIILCYPFFSTSQFDSRRRMQLRRLPCRRGNAVPCGIFKNQEPDGKVEIFQASSEVVFYVVNISVYYIYICIYNILAWVQACEIHNKRVCHIPTTFPTPTLLSSRKAQQIRSSVQEAPTCSAARRSSPGRGTVDRRNPAPPGMYKTLEIMG